MQTQVLLPSKHIHTRAWLVCVGKWRELWTHKVWMVHTQLPVIWLMRDAWSISVWLHWLGSCFVEITVMAVRPHSHSSSPTPLGLLKLLSWKPKGKKRRKHRQKQRSFVKKIYFEVSPLRLQVIISKSFLLFHRKNCFCS